MGGLHGPIGMVTEDPPEDITTHAEFRQRANAASGWNGSHELYRPEPLSGGPCPADLWAKLQALRAAAADRAAVYRPA